MTSDYSLPSLVRRILNSHLVRLALVGAITLILLIPVAMIRGLIQERQQRHHTASEEVTSKWGFNQILTGPALVLPYTVRETQKTASGEVTARVSVKNAVFLPKRLRETGVITMESRERGIFLVPVYTLTLNLEGEFEKPGIEALGIDPASVAWDQAHLSIGISDVRALRSSSNLSWNGSETEFLPGPSGLMEATQGLHAPVAINAQDSKLAFSFPLSLNGSGSVYVVPFAEETVVQLTSNSPHPNFQGNWLPTDRTVSEAGFDATWRVSYLGRNYPQLWVSGTGMSKSIDSSRFGVELSDPIDQYRLADRSVKYAGLFILLTFASIWLIEVLMQASVHPVQYVMLGAGLCMFYLLELSLSEHIGFSLAYGIASLAVIAMVAGYSTTIFRRASRAGLVASGVTLLYAYLYVVLTNEDAALLVGSIGLFVILAGIMFVTRGLNWYAPPTHQHRDLGQTPNS